MARRLAAAAFAAVAIVLFGAACGGGQSRADKVTTYLENVNAVQTRLQFRIAAVGRAYRALQTGTKLEKLAPQLDQSVTTIATLERRLDALDPPPEAQRLDRTVREVVHEDWELAREFALLARYTPAAAAPLARAAAAGQQLRHSLGATKKPREQAAALDAYAVALDSAAGSLAKLRPPQVAEAEHRIEVERFRRTAASARGVADALRRGKGQQEAIHRLQLAFASGSSIRSQKERIADIEAFNRRIVHVRALDAKAQRQRTRLERALRS
jgi:hypothetical protein